MMHKLALAGLFAVLALMAQGCSSTIRISRTRPPVFQIKDNQKIALQVEADGTAPSAATVMDAAISFGQGQLLNKWLAVEPVRNEFDAQFRNAAYQLVPADQADLIIRVRPVNWSYHLESAKSVRSGSGRLDVRLEILDAHNPNGGALYSATYWGSASANNLGEPEAMLRSAQRIAGRFIADLKPYRVWEEVEMDRDEELVKPAIELCEDGQFDAAYQMLSDIVRAHPNSPAALYDLGVLAEARGSYDEAEQLVTQATQYAQKPIYYTALERIRRSRSDAQALQDSP
ncbi:MAG: tetratricopeptide repeat protein [Myxococcaceae bacterium]|nr:tetratricopeptide repeat protein [Myxococcaceae bacterium]